MSEEKLVKIGDKEQRILEAIKEVEYGEIRIIVQEGKPVRIEEIKKSIRL